VRRRGRLRLSCRRLRADTTAWLLAASVTAAAACEQTPPADRAPVADRATALRDDTPEHAAGARVFDPRRVARIALTLSDADLASLRGATREQREHGYVPARFAFDGGPELVVGVRAKGRHSLQLARGRTPSLLIDFARSLPGQTFDGLSALHLEGRSADPTALRDALGYGVFRELGIAAPRTGWAHLRIRGEDLGLHTTVEAVDTRMLRRHFPDASGALYYADAPAGSLAWRGARYEDYTGLHAAQPPRAGHGPLLRVLELLARGNDEQLGQVLDMEAALTYLAASNALGNPDAYQGRGRNFSLYERVPGRFTILPWDLDLAFQPTAPLCGPSPDDPAYPLSRRVFASDALRARYFERMRFLLEGPASSQRLGRRMDEALSVTGAYVTASAAASLRAANEARTAALLQALRASDPCRAR
jgi:hypothetical protein